eukprot:TRINITY_DN13146_c0_g1_i1.p1 TRINITY_DN13146_c0_g1~~TRINITY_DN13146_c0_g1_i1.p1  ORF type:complete len:143 (+),score=9.30 TRINITY_DN13146_c0_g1_i1:28-429(+)
MEEFTRNVRFRAAGSHGPFINRRAVVDSGAFMSVVDYDTGKAMGFRRSPNDLQNMHKFKTDTGRGGYLKRDMELGIGNHRTIVAPVAWMDKPTTASAGTTLGTVPLLGRRGLFKHYAVTFTGADHKVHFERTT